MMQQAKSRVLVLGDDMRIFLAVARSLGRAGHQVHAAPVDPEAPALRSRYVRKVHVLPNYESDPDGWVAGLAELLGNEAFDLVIPCTDPPILLLHKHRDAFAGHRIAIPNPGAMTDLFDKARTRRLAQILDIPVAAGKVLERGDDAGQLASRFGLPLVIKARQSYRLDRMGAAGKVWILDSEAEVAERLAAISEPSDFLVESFFRDSVGVGVSVLAREGRICQAFQHRRLREGRGGSSSYRISEAADERLLDACRRIASHVDLTGVGMFEFRWRPSDEAWLLLETNVRFWGSLPLPVSLGVDFPQLLHDMTVRGAAPHPAAYPVGVRSRNLVLDAHHILSSARPLRLQRLPGIGADLLDFAVQPLRWLAGREHSDSFVLDDPWPGFAEIRSVAKRRGRRGADITSAGDRTSGTELEIRPANSARAA